MILNAGCDQLGGEARPELVVHSDLVRLLDVRRVTSSRIELYSNGPLLSATENHQLDHTAGCCLERPEQIVHATNGLASCLNDQVAGGKLGTRRWTVVFHEANQQPISIW